MIQLQFKLDVDEDEGRLIPYWTTLLYYENYHESISYKDMIKRMMKEFLDKRYGIEDDKPLKFRKIKRYKSDILKRCNFIVLPFHQIEEPLLRRFKRFCEEMSLSNDIGLITIIKKYVYDRIGDFGENIINYMIIGKQNTFVVKTNDMVPSKEDLRSIFETHKQITPVSCIPMLYELLLKLLGVVESNYFVLQERYGDKKQSSKTFEGMFDNRIKDIIPFGVRTPLCDLVSLFKTINNYLELYQFVIIYLKSDTKYQDTSGEYHPHLLYKYDKDLDEYYGLTYYNNKPSQPQFESEIKQKLKWLNGTQYQYYETSEPIQNQDKENIENVIEERRKFPVLF